MDDDKIVRPDSPERADPPTRPVGKGGVSDQKFKFHEKSAVQLVHSMAIRSLDPDMFDDLEAALKALCETRGLDVNFADG